LARIKAGIDRYWAPVLAPCGGSWRQATSPVSEPSPTIMTRDYQGLAIPVEGRDGKSAASVGQPLRTMTTRNETGLAYLTSSQPSNGSAGSRPPFIAELRGGSSDARPTSDPLATVTASGNHHGLVTCYYGTGGCKPTSDALSTVTAIERHALLMRNNTGGAEMCTPVSEVARTITAAGHQSLLTRGEPASIDLDDVRFRMLEPAEIAAAMDFPSTYVILGNRRETVRQAGNAVTPPAARDLVSIVAEVLGAA
jgi:DNA (cytosine-5)-methyltransferase 1